MAFTYRERRSVRQLALRIRQGDASATTRALLADLIYEPEQAAWETPDGELADVDVAIDAWVAAANPPGRPPSATPPAVVCPVRISPDAAAIVRARGREAGAWLSRLIEATRPNCEHCLVECDCDERQAELDRDRGRLR